MSYLAQPELPWRNLSDWLNVKHDVCSMEYSKLKVAHDRIVQWSNKCTVPAYVDATVKLIDAVLFDRTMCAKIMNNEWTAEDVDDNIIICLRAATTFACYLSSLTHINFNDTLRRTLYSGRGRPAAEELRMAITNSLRWMQAEDWAPKGEIALVARTQETGKRYDAIKTLAYIVKMWRSLASKASSGEDSLTEPHKNRIINEMKHVQYGFDAIGYQPKADHTNVKKWIKTLVLNNGEPNRVFSATMLSNVMLALMSEFVQHFSDEWSIEDAVTIIVDCGIVCDVAPLSFEKAEPVVHIIQRAKGLNSLVRALLQHISCGGASAIISFHWLVQFSPSLRWIKSTYERYEELIEAQNSTNPKVKKWAQKVVLGMSQCATDVQIKPILCKPLAISRECIEEMVVFPNNLTKDALFTCSDFIDPPLPTHRLVRMAELIVFHQRLALGGLPFPPSVLMDPILRELYALCQVGYRDNFPNPVDVGALTQRAVTPRPLFPDDDQPNRAQQG